MQKHLEIGTAILALGLAATGCAGFATEGRSGIRVYDPAYYIVVTEQAGKYQTATFIGPDLRSHYEIRPRSFLAENKFSIELQDGMLKKALDELDTTAVLDFIEGSGKLAAEAARGVAAAGTEAADGAPGGLTAGIYVWDGRTLTRLEAPRPGSEPR